MTAPALLSARAADSVSEAHGYPAEVTSTMLVLVREGEQRRHERGDG